MEVTVTAIRTGQVATPAGYVFRRGDSALRFARALLPPWKSVQLACHAFVVRHPAAGTLLVDTGMHADVSTDLRKDFGTPMSVLFGRLRPAAEPFDRQLRALGIDPSGIRRVLMTHLHVDHTSGMRLLPHASFVCTREEWAAAGARGASALGYVRHHLPAEERVEQVDFGLDGERFGPFARTIDLFGDGSVRLVSSRGHTAGHMTVLLRATGGRQVLLAGDAAYTLRSIHAQALPLFTASDRLYRSTLRELRDFSVAEPNALLVPSHDPAAGQELPALDAPAA